MNTYRYRDLAGIGIPYSRAHLSTLMALRSFPKATQLMNGTVVWDRAEVDAWLASVKVPAPA